MVTVPSSNPGEVARITLLPPKYERNSIEATPSRMATSDLGSLDGGLQGLARPVGNSPRPDSIVNVTGGAWLIGLPFASCTVTRSFVPFRIVQSRHSRAG